MPRPRSRRSKIVYFRVTPTEHAALHAAAEQQHRDVSSWVRHVMLLALDRPDEEKEEQEQPLRSRVQAAVAS